MEKMKFDVIIIGGGAAGLFLAASLPANLKVALVESNDRVGKKLLATQSINHFRHDISRKQYFCLQFISFRGKNGSIS